MESRRPTVTLILVLARRGGVRSENEMRPARSTTPIVEMNRTGEDEFSARSGGSEGQGVPKPVLTLTGFFYPRSEPPAAEIIEVGGVLWAVPKPVAQIKE